MVGVPSHFAQHGASVPHLGWDVIDSDAVRGIGVAACGGGLAPRHH